MSKKRAHKHYVVHTDADGQVSIDIDGVHYASPNEILNPEDRAQVERLLSHAPDESPVEVPVRRPSLSPFILIVAIFGGVGALLVLITVWWSFNIAQSAAREKSAPGRVVDLVVRYDNGIASDSRATQTPNPYYYPVVEFTSSDEKLHTVQTSEGSWPPDYEKGQSVTVLYDPQQPLHARIKSTSSTVLQWLGPGIVGLVGVCFLIAAAAGAWVLRSDREETASKA